MKWFKNRRYANPGPGRYKQLLAAQSKFKRRRERITGVPMFNRIAISIDTGNKPNSWNDPTGITVWGYSLRPRRFVLIFAVNRWLAFPKLVKVTKSLHRQFRSWNRGPVPLLIEDKGSGTSLIQTLESETYIKIIKVQPVASKTVRMEEVTVVMEREEVWLPAEGETADLVNTEYIQFPFGGADNLCDSTSQFLSWIGIPKYRRSAGTIYFK